MKLLGLSFELRKLYEHYMKVQCPSYQLLNQPIMGFGRLLLNIFITNYLTTGKKMKLI